MKTQANRLKKLIQANQVLASIESLVDLLPQLLRLAQDVTGAEASSIMLYNKEKNVLNFAWAMNDVLGDKAMKNLKTGFELPMGQGIAGWVAEHQQPLNVVDAQSDDRFSKEADRKTGFTTKCILCTPIIHNDELLGVVQVLNSVDKECFGKEDEELLESFGHLAGVALVRSELMLQRLNQQKFETQLEAAARIQKQFNPRQPKLEGGNIIWGSSLPAQFVGGDLYDFIPNSDGSWYIYVADVSGKGLPAALIMSALWTRIRAEALNEKAPGEMLKAVNSGAFDFMNGEVFATMALLRYFPESGKCEYSMAGHPPPFLVDEGTADPIEKTFGLPVGILEDGDFETGEFCLEKGQSLVIVSDGVDEARDAQGEFFGEERMEETLRQEGVPQAGEKLLKAVADWRGETPPNDDTTVVEIYRA
ncbi:GAF domain-containing SpoIIE family protein phosphatase [Desulfovibrio sp. JC010]|uniref:GAF domain-containing SpoIIE family protein phosphatase n=1 Tax=Desulfovibrio sp. JC010 TaxID=2593641 RepID=UPI0013D7FECF|nr:GAF domain-containing SpoIIE family protein phosphatase [Desulfovibrio sp. JC010]NDV26199.1 SpoIIE family protein phosphatase [Desulfovibrio sp. JC010]